MDLDKSASRQEIKHWRDARFSLPMYVVGLPACGLVKINFVSDPKSMH